MNTTPEHIWIDGPDGPGYHCKQCGISKCDDHGLYNTCLSWQKNKRKHKIGYHG